MQNVPVFVAANKGMQGLRAVMTAALTRLRLFYCTLLIGFSVFNVCAHTADLCPGLLMALQSHSHHHHPHLTMHHSHDHHHELNPALKDLAQLVRKQWKCSYTECSTLYNWRVIPMFKELFKAIEASQFKQEQASHHHRKHDHHEHRESLKSSSLTTTQRTNASSRTSNHTSRTHHSCHLL